MEFRIHSIHVPGDRTAIVVLTIVAVIAVALLAAIVAVSLIDAPEVKEMSVVMEINRVRMEEHK